MALYLRDKNGELKELTVTAASSTSAAKVTYKDGTVDDELTQLNNAISDHISSTANPHKVTKEQIGLTNVVNTADSSVPVKDGLTKFTTGGAFTELGKKLDSTTAENTYLKKTDASATYAAKTDLSSKLDSSAAENTYLKKTDASTAYAAKTDLSSKLDSATASSTYATKTELGTKVDKVTGKSLSTNDYTTAEKNKLAGLSNYNDSNVFKNSLNTIDENSILTTLPGNRSGSYNVSHTGWSGGVDVFYNTGSNSGLALYRPGGSNSIPQILVSVDSKNSWVNKGEIATLSTAQTFSAKKTFSGGINVPTKAPSNPQEGDLWIE